MDFVGLTRAVGPRSAAYDFMEALRGNKPKNTETNLSAASLAAKYKTPEQIEEDKRREAELAKQREEEEKLKKAEEQALAEKQNLKDVPKISVPEETEKKKKTKLISPRALFGKKGRKK